MYDPSNTAMFKCDCHNCYICKYDYFVINYIFSINQFLFSICIDLSYWVILIFLTAHNHNATHSRHVVRYNYMYAIYCSSFIGAIEVKVRETTDGFFGHLNAQMLYSTFA